MNSLNFIACDASYDEAEIVIFGAGFDGTTTFRPGTRFAPNVIRNESIGIETYSPVFNADIEEYKICDDGDLELVFGNTKHVVNQIYTKTKEIVDANKIPFMIGGEHLVSLGSIQAVYEKYPNLHIIHFDAHTDLREDYLGEKLSHSTVLKRVYDFVGTNKIFQFGIRSGTKNEFDFAKNKVYQNLHNLDTLDVITSQLSDVPVYITIDLDVLDPSIMSGTGTPEAGGITYLQLQEGLKHFLNLKNIVGVDVVELAPNYDNSGTSTAVAAKIIRELLLITMQSKEI